VGRLLHHFAYNDGYLFLLTYRQNLILCHYEDFYKKIRDNPVGNVKGIKLIQIQLFGISEQLKGFCGYWVGLFI